MMLINSHILEPSPLPLGAVAQWKGEGNANDLGGVYHGTEGSAPDYDIGYDGASQGFAFDDNVNEKVTLPTINIGSAWSYEFWFKKSFASGTPRTLIGNAGDAGSNFGVIESVGSADFSGVIRYTQNSTLRLTTPLFGKLNNFYKVTVTYDGSKVRVYINDQLLTTESGTHSETYNNPAGIGQYMSGVATGPFQGVIDEVTLYNSEVTRDLASVGNKVLQYNCANALDSIHTWNATDGTTPLYGDGSDGSPNGAWYFDGTTNNNARRLHPIFPTSAWSIEMDIRPETGGTGNRVILGSGYNSNANSVGLIGYDGTNKRVFYWHNSTSRFNGTNNSVPLDTWTTIKITYDGSKARLYVNGVLNSTEAGTHSGSWNLSGASAFFGTQDTVFGATFFKGRMDNIKIYNAVV